MKSIKSARGRASKPKRQGETITPEALEKIEAEFFVPLTASPKREAPAVTVHRGKMVSANDQPKAPVEIVPQQQGGIFVPLIPAEAPKPTATPVVYGNPTTESLPELIERYEATCRALAVVVKVDEAMEFRDKAEALRNYYARTKNRDAELLSAEIKVRAERRAGQLLVEMGLSGARQQRGGDRKSAAAGSKSQPATLIDLTISKHDSSRFQKMADLTEKQFEGALNGARVTRKPITSAALRKLGRSPPRPDPNDGRELWDANYAAAKAARDRARRERQLREIVGSVPHTEAALVGLLLPVGIADLINERFLAEFRRQLDEMSRVRVGGTANTNTRSGTVGAS